MNKGFWHWLFWTKDEVTRPERKLLTYILGGMVPASVAITLYNLISLLLGQDNENLVVDVIITTLAVILFFINRRGWWKPISYGLLAVMLAGGITDRQIFSVAAALVIAAASLYGLQTSLIFTLATIIVDSLLYGSFSFWHTLVYVGTSCIFSLMGRLNRQYFLRSAKSERELKRHLERLQTLNGIERKLSSTLDITEIMDIIMTNLKLIVPYDSISIQLLEEHSLVILACRGLPDGDQYVNRVISLDEEQPGKLVIETKEPLAFEDMTLEYTQFKASSLGKIRSWLGMPLIVKEKVTGLITLDRFEVKPFSEIEIRTAQSFASWSAVVLENARLFNKTQTRVAQLRTLHNIDKAISNVIDRDMMLRILLDHIVTQLGVDAACVLLYDPHLHTLEYHAERGFRNSAIRGVRLRLGEGYAGKTAKDRHNIQIVHIDRQDAQSVSPSQLVDEDFKIYIGIPLFAKSQLMGVLEVYQRSAFTPDQDWLDFFIGLAGQVAIAIENTNMFSGLLRANQELDLAYDQTLEGWARALEYRDMETEGHSRRVCEMTTTLACEFGIQGKDLTNVRRGALLHDIGKMAVPDDILQKPGPLDEPEWEIIKKHPLYAYEMLKEIDYLHPALDIPLYHHEKWDGTGYPYGLEEDQIPLVARIFAIVDVWDALTSNRPYRRAWSEKKVKAYIREQSDRHFDPKVVDAFFKIISQ